MITMITKIVCYTLALWIVWASAWHVGDIDGREFWSRHHGSWAAFNINPDVVPQILVCSTESSGRGPITWAPRSNRMCYMDDKPVSITVEWVDY